jgi:hypothetical protein
MRHFCSIYRQPRSKELEQNESASRIALVAQWLAQVSGLGTGLDIGLEHSRRQ